MRIVRFYQTSVGKKVVVALTGVIMFLFLIGHMAGNLKVFLGAAAFDHYAEALRVFMSDFVGQMTLLWTARVVLLACLVLHIVTVLQLARQNRAARPEKYAKQVSQTATFSSKYMMVSGLLLLAFIIFHILHFTTGTLSPTEFEHGKVYANVYGSFQLWWMVAIYIAGMLIVAWHLYHGVWSMFQTLGLNNPDRGLFLKRFATGSAVALFLGFVFVPTSIFLGITEEVPAEHAHSSAIVQDAPGNTATDDADPKAQALRLLWQLHNTLITENGTVITSSYPDPVTAEDVEDLEAQFLRLLLISNNIVTTDSCAPTDLVSASNADDTEAH